MNKEKIKHTNTIEMVCPHCGYEYDDSYEYNQYGGSTDCENEKCGKRFNYKPIIKTRYTTSKIKPMSQDELNDLNKHAAGF